jgi:hypothetical protein
MRRLVLQLTITDEVYEREREHEVLTNVLILTRESLKILSYYFWEQGTLNGYALTALLLALSVHAMQMQRAIEERRT